jgi:adenosylcobinamide-phosphate synthase
MSIISVAAWSLPLGTALDLFLGDPRGWPHPVRAIGWLITRVEGVVRSAAARLGGRARVERAAGCLLALAVVGATSLTVLGLLALFERLGPWPALLGRSILIFWGLAAHSLGREALSASEAPELETARRTLSQVVGRDTDRLDRSEICRACVETVAENTSDAVVAPLFWYAVGGPIGLWAFKAINTLDSMVGYRNARYANLGWASARLDDLAGLIPARLSWLLLSLAALVAGARPAAAFRVGWRDGRKHPSPNAAWSEAAVAGALGIQLGGPATYGGILSIKPTLGDPGPAIEPAHVRRAVRLLHVTTALAFLLAWGVRSWVLGLA